MNPNNMTKVDNFNHKKVYVGSHVDFGDIIKSPNRCLFVTPYKGIASIFTCDRNLYRQGATPGIDKVNIGYEEWGLDISDLKKPFETIHVKIEGDPNYNPTEFKTSGYIYEIDMSKYKNNIYQYDWMDKDREFLIVGFDEIEFVKKQKHETTRIVKGYPSRDNRKQESEIYKESKIDDIRNGVNPYSNKLFFHISFDDSLDGKVLKPRIPSYIASTYGEDTKKAQEEMKKSGYIEDITTPRVCFSNSIEGCLNAIMNMDKVLHTAGKEVYVYIPEKPIEKYKHKTNKEIVKEKLVFDAKATQEMWILEDVKLKLYGTIVIDKIYNKTLKNVLDPNKKKSDNKIGYNHFKWHWQCNPKILQESTLSSDERDDLVGSEFGIPDKRKYPLTDKTHVLKAVQFFKFADISDKPELAKRIINKAKEFNMDYSNWNSIKEYLSENIVKEGFDMNYDRFGNQLDESFSIHEDQQLMMEAVSPEKAEKNRKENLKLLQYDPKKRTIVVDGPDGQPMTVKASITNFDVNSVEIATGFTMKRQIYVGSDKHGDPYIRIPPSYLEKDPSMLMPLIDHEVEHVNQLNHQKQRTGDKVGHVVARDDECVLEYARKFIKKHGKLLNEHDRLEYELLADFHAALKHGRKSYMKALRNIGEYGWSLKKLKNQTIDVFEDTNPQLKLFRKGDHSVKSHIKVVKAYLKKCEYVKKNCEKVIELSEKQAETYTNTTMFGDTYETNINETYKSILDTIKTMIFAAKTTLDALNGINSDTISEDDKKQFKLMNTSVKVSTSKSMLISHMIKSIVSTELRGKFIKQIMKDKPWLNDSNDKNINESYVLGEFNDFDIDSEFIEEYGYESFNELSMFLEGDSTNDDNIVSNSDYVENDNVDISTFGSDSFNKSPNNEYDETEVKILNELIADEQNAVGRYFDAAKNSKDPNLSRLYADIGAEERFHTEQLMYSKSLLTGEEYTPHDPDVKKEYEELLAMGMDEESAMTTAIDKRSMSSNYDDGDDSDVDELQKDVEMLEYAVDSQISILNTIDMICESEDFTMEQRDTAMNVLLESFIIQEAVDNVRPGGNTQNIINNPIAQLINGFTSFLKFIRQLCDKFKNFINRNKVKQARLREFIKTNGIFGIFKPGVSLYFYDPKTPGDLSVAPFQYVELMNNVAVDIMKEHGLTTGLDKIDLGLSTLSIRYSNATQGLAILNGVVLTKTKIIVNDNNKNAIEELFFGFNKDVRVNVNSPDKYDTIMRSGNIYNKLNNLLNWVDLSCKKIDKSIQAIQNLQSVTNSIYYTNRNQYNSCIEKLQQVQKSFNKFLKALVSDINTVMKLNNGILEATNAKDDEFNKQQEQDSQGFKEMGFERVGNNILRPNKKPQRPV